MNMQRALSLFVCVASLLLQRVPADAVVLFEDDFNRGFPGWTEVTPPGAYQEGPLRWQYDVVSGAFLEQSNIYGDTSSSTAGVVAPMLINDTVTGTSFTYAARLTAGDDDGFGLIFGCQNETNFYRVCFARQSRAAFPWTGWNVERMVGMIRTTNLFGAGAAGYVASFINTSNRLFDVTISVDAANKLTLTVVDNPTGSPTTYNLVTSKTLPFPADGKVGIFTWGMAGGVPRGFRIQNLNLSPTPLTGNPNSLTNWTAVVPPRANGSSTLSGGTGQPCWSLSVGTNGAWGTLREDSDSFAGDDTAGRVDFTGPTIVAGDDTWSYYTVAARIKPGDDDGHGILLHYKDITNFYRICLRSQNSATGPPRGLSVQKNQNRVYTEIFRETTPQFDPVSGVIYDLVTTVSNDTLYIMAVKDPENAAQEFRYGPVTISGVHTGKVGLFSWGMAQMEFDWVTVHDGTPIYVSSSFGNPFPSRGLTSLAQGSVCTVWAGLPITDVPGRRRIPYGWNGSGSVPASGNGTNITFTLTNLTRVSWLWRTEYQLNVSNGPNGTVSGPAGNWFVAGTNITLTPTPNAGYVFAGWSGDIFSSAASLSLTMTQAFTLTANFAADNDADGLADGWENGFFGNLSANPSDDADRDSRSNLQEYQNGTNPNVPDILLITGLTISNNLAVLSVTNNTGTRYDVQQTTNKSLPAPTWAIIARTQLANKVTATLPAQHLFWRLQQPARAADVLPFVAGSWTLVVLPDTQFYSESYPEFFKDQTRWIVANKERYNIKYVLHLGDIVNLPMDTNQWNNAKAAMSILDGQVPYAFVTGNHDHGTNGLASDRTTIVNNYFPVSLYTNWPTFGGTMETNRIENSYHLFSAGGADWIVFALEWGPRNSPVAWANQILNNHPNRRAILITHAYMYSDDTRYNWAAKGPSQSWNPYSYGTANDPGGTNDGEDLWRKLVKLHPNFVMVFNGHVVNDGLARLSSSNDFGGVVHQMLVNYQGHALGGEGYLRLVEFLPDGKTVQVKAYSPLYGTYRTDSQNQFTLTLDPPL